ncbi:hypothetical protein KPL76_06655 [Subtercola sp. PAMC28395]|uniref:hypothetical protein n=1 Tax=Subtercola sp. PAMC28395 TaxID=2846775 RepID=UPI001C0B7115|nr:hypothetical protein [Subtercola sp. PAMC28395]QWT25022.1 hypothetical protein KPL76_06655 [Subtercola sp. PAMC28395]
MTKNTIVRPAGAAGGGRARLSRIARSELPWYALTAGLSALLTYFALGLSTARLSVPWYYTGDAIASADHFKTTLEQGWYEHNPDLGAPAGQNYNDFPVADNLHMIAAKVLGLFDGRWPVVVNMYFFLGFIFAALAAYWFFRVCRIWRPLSVALGILFALAPYHFVRGEGHLFLASYYCIPLGLGLLVWLMRGEAIWTARPSRYRWWGILTGRGAFAVVALALLATSATYYGVFFIILLVFAAVFVLVRDRNWRRFLGAAGLGLVTVLVMAINSAPDVIFGWTNGQNPGGFFRQADETEIYSLKLSQLILPWNGSRIPLFHTIRTYYDQTFPLPSEEPALGLVGALGLIISFLVIAYAVVAWRRTAKLSTQPQTRAQKEVNGHLETIGFVSVLTLVCFLFATMGGLSTLISFFTSALRGWNRMSIEMAALCLVAFGLALQLAITWVLARVNASKVIAGVTIGVVSLGVLGVGYIDQTPSSSGQDASHAAVIATYDSDKAFFAGLEAQLPAESMVLQLPYIPFPEAVSANGIQASDELIPFMQTTQLRWSAGGIKGRPQSNWPYPVSQLPTADLVKLAAASNMAGILVDTWAFDDHGAAQIAALTATLAQTPSQSQDGHWVFFSLAQTRADLLTRYSASELDAVGRVVTDPVTLSMLPDFKPTSSDDQTEGGSKKAVAPRFTLLNDRSDTAQIELTFTLKAPNNPAETATVSFADGTTESVTFDVDGATTVTHAMSLPPGSSTVQIAVAGATATKPPELQISHLTIQEKAVSAFLGNG